MLWRVKLSTPCLDWPTPTGIISWFQTLTLTLYPVLLQSQSGFDVTALHRLTFTLHHPELRGAGVTIRSIQRNLLPPCYFLWLGVLVTFSHFLNVPVDVHI